jgi:hypothetical protein
VLRGLGYLAVNLIELKVVLCHDHQKSLCWDQRFSAIEGVL